VETGRRGKFQNYRDNSELKKVEVAGGHCKAKRRK
jgi:hypothetical protein